MRARGQKIVGRSCPIDKKLTGVLALNRCAPIFFAFILLGINSEQGRAQAADKDLIEGLPIEGRSGVVDSQVSGAGQLSELFYRIQVLQQDLKDLRGTIEEQSYLIKRLERSQKEQYLDLDNRLVQLGGAELESRAAQTEDKESSEEATTFLNEVPEFDNEREAYQYAFDLMRNRQYQESLAGFEEIIVAFPNGQYTPNAFYWIGELYLAQGDNEKSRQSFIQVISLYPDHQKVPDAMYKLGVVYFALGDNQSAIRYLGQVQQEYPNSSAAGLAARYSVEIQ
jgi:tol-pal system protein YbgF